MLAFGGIELNNRVAVAPMSGISDLPFRRAASRCGAGLVVSEMVASEELSRARPDVVRRAAGDGSVFPFVIQLAGREAKWMAEGARLAEAAGADAIDINMGCPSRQVTGALSGSALMRDLDHALSLVDAVVGATSKPVTLKMRLGWDWNSLNAPELAQRAEQAGVTMFVVHGRTRNDFYKGKANWAAVRPVVDAVKVPVIVNGDVTDPQSAEAALKASGADGVMIGRATVGRPWLAGQVAAFLDGKTCTPPSLADREDIAVSHYREMIDLYGEPLGIRMARKHLAAYVEAFAGEYPNFDAKAVRRMLCTSNSAGRVERGLMALFRKEFERIEALLAA